MKRTTLWMALAWWVSGCGSSLPLEAFHEGRYPRAAEDLRALEAELYQFEPEEQARYALYRGLTHLSLGDARAADCWLRVAKVMSDREPKWFDADERGALLSAWRSMGHMPGE